MTTTLKTDAKTVDSLFNDAGQLRVLLDNLDLYFYTKDNQGAYVFVSQGVCNLFGLPAEQIVGRIDADFFDLERSSSLFQHDQRVLLAGESIHAEEELLLKRNGMQLVVLSIKIPLHDAQKQVVGLCGISVDISKQLRNTDELVAQNQLLDTVLSNVEAFVYQKDGNGNYLYVNQHVADLYGRSAEDIIGKSDDALLPPDVARNLKELDQEVLKGGVRQKQQEMIRGRDGTERFFWSVKVPLKLPGQPWSIVGFSSEITELLELQRKLQRSNEELERRVVERTVELTKALDDLRKAQDDLIQSAKLASLGQMVAGVSHELNTPIGNAVTVASALVHHAKTLDASLQDGTLTRSQLGSELGGITAMTELIERSVNRAATLITSFKQVAVDQTSERRREFELYEVVEDVIGSLRPGFKNKPWKIVNDIPLGVRCDSFPGPLEQILTNLIQNAVLHAFPGRDSGTITITNAVKDDRLDLTVSDNGIGMDTATLVRIFDPFFTTKLGKGGSGLGLSICYRIASNVLAGELKAVSLPGSGTSFTLNMPLRTPGKI